MTSDLEPDRPLPQQPPAVPPLPPPPRSPLLGPEPAAWHAVVPPQPALPQPALPQPALTPEPAVPPLPGLAAAPVLPPGVPPRPGDANSPIVDVDNSRVAALPQGGGRLLTASFDVLTAARSELRGGSLYLGLVFLLTVAPLALLAWAFVVGGSSLADALANSSGGPGAGQFDPSDPTAYRATQFSGAILATAVIALAGIVVTTVEGQAIAVALVASHLIGRPLSLRAALIRSRAVFWRLVKVGLIVGIPLGIVEFVIELAFNPGPNSEAPALLATGARTLIGIPVVYAATGIVLGDVGALEAVRRSIRIARARPRTALIVSLFAAIAQYLLVFGLGEAGDVILRIAQPLGLSPEGGPAVVLTVAAILLVAVLAFGTLQFTVVAIATAPQVVAFLALTHFTAGMDRARMAVESPAASTPIAPSIGPDGRLSYWATQAAPARFRWLTLTLLAGVALGIAALVGGILQIVAS